MRNRRIDFLIGVWGSMIMSNTIEGIFSKLFMGLGIVYLILYAVAGSTEETNED